MADSEPSVDVAPGCYFSPAPSGVALVIDDLVRAMATDANRGLVVEQSLRAGLVVVQGVVLDMGCDIDRSAWLVFVELAGRLEHGRAEPD